LFLKKLRVACDQEILIGHESNQIRVSTQPRRLRPGVNAGVAELLRLATNLGFKLPKIRKQTNRTSLSPISLSVEIDPSQTTREADAGE